MDFPLINGDYCSWACLEIKLAIFGGLTFVTADFTALDFEESKEPGVVPGTGGYARGRTGGMYLASASMSMNYERCVTFQQALEAIALAQGKLTPNGKGDKWAIPFDVIAQWTPNGLLLVHSIKIPGARLMNLSSSNAPGPDAASVTMPLSVIQQLEWT